MDMPPFKASDGDLSGNGPVSEDFAKSEFLFRQGMIPIRLKVRPEAFPKGIPMSVWSKFYQYPG
jgi:hypothetical protein